MVGFGVYGEQTFSLELTEEVEDLDLAREHNAVSTFLKPMPTAIC